MVKSQDIMAEVTRRRYTEEFKREAVRESAHPVAQVARDLGIPDNVWYRLRFSAEDKITGMWTKPKLIAPFHNERGITRPSCRAGLS